MKIIPLLFSKVSDAWKDWKILLSESCAMLSQNIGKIIAFVLIYTAIGLMTLDVVIPWLYEAALLVTGMDHVGPDTIFVMLRHPIVILLWILFSFLLCALSVFEISGILHACSMAKVGKKTTLEGMIQAALHGCISALHPKNWLMIPFILILMPLTGILSFCTPLLMFAIPEFVRDYIVANNILGWVYRALYLLLVFVELRYIFVFHGFALGEKGFFPSCRFGARLIRKNYGRTVGFLLLIGVAVWALQLSMATVVSEAGTKIASLFAEFGGITQSSYANMAASLLSGFLQAVIAPALILAALTVLFFQYVEEKEVFSELSKKSFSDTRLNIPSCIFVGVFLLTIFISYGVMNRDAFDGFFESCSRPAIIAHRGDSVRAPENTKPAFELAVAENPEWVEFDVQQTKDGVVVVCHDDDLTRVAGQTLYVHELTYAETQELDVGSWFDPEFSYVRLSTLDEILKLFKDTDIKLQIEIKISGYEDHLEEKVLETINANDMHDRCIITSLQPEPLKRINELDPSVITTYSMYIAWQGIENIEFSKYYTIEQSNFTRGVVNTIHAQGKQCFAWTANTEETIQYLVDCGVDGILTDDPLMLDRALDQADYSGGLWRYLRLLTSRLKNGY